MRSVTQAGSGAAKTSGVSAGLSGLLFPVELWLRARLLPLQLVGRSLKEMLEFAEPPVGSRRFAGLSPAYVVRAVRRATRRPWVMRDRRCLREGLLAYRSLVEAGLRPRLHFGVERDVVNSARVAAHCWVTLEGRTVIGESETPYVEILVHPADGAM